MTKFRRTAAAAIAVLAFATSPAPALRAQDLRPPAGATSAGVPSSDLPLADYRAFDRFAAAHPEIVSDLGHDPQLLEDSEYLAKHPELRNFLASHSELRDALISHPGDFIEPHGNHPPL
jgi:hypothetical protein